MFSGIWRKAKKKNMKKERKFGLKEFPRPLTLRNGAVMALGHNRLWQKGDILKYALQLKNSP